MPISPVRTLGGGSGGGGFAATAKHIAYYVFHGANASSIDVEDFKVARHEDVSVSIYTDGTTDILDGGLHTSGGLVLFGLTMPALAADTARVYTVTGRVAGAGASDGYIDLCVDQDGVNNVGTCYYQRLILSSGMHRTHLFRRDAWTDSYPFGSSIAAHFNASDLFFTNTIIQTDTDVQGSQLLHNITGQRGVGSSGGTTSVGLRNSQYASVGIWPGTSEIRVDSIAVIDTPNPA